MNRVLDTKITCTACGRAALGVMFINSKPYHRFCGEEIDYRAAFSPKDHWVKADSHNYKGEQYRRVKAWFNGQLYIGWSVDRLESCFIYDGLDLFVNLSRFMDHSVFPA